MAKRKGAIVVKKGAIPKNGKFSVSMAATKGKIPK